MVLQSIKLSLTAVFLSFVFVLVTGCDSNNQYDYDKGYEAAWEGKKKASSLWANREEKEGYQQGLDDSSLYDEGYYDGYNREKANYFNEAFYMDGFKDGKENR